MANVYWDKAAMERDQVYPSILAIGDSWFWYPFPGGSLLNPLGEMLAQEPHIIYAKGMNGAEAYDYVDGKYATQVRVALKLYGKALAAVFISGGGNDFAGFNDLRPLLKDDCRQETTPLGCFRTGPGGLDGFLERVDHHYRKLIGLVYAYTEPGCKILLHTYAYAVPDGRGVGGSAWLKPALAAAGVPDGLQAECVRLLLQRFRDVLLSIAAGDPKQIAVVDSLDALSAEDWANELHPTPGGFRKIAARWKPVLHKAGLLRKPG